MKAKVSIIVPVYNVEKYLEQCLKSITNQTLKNIEIICVNDGSTDKSLDILSKYKEKDDRIKIIDKKNEGLGEARNVGMNIASGEYLGFVDSDDWVDLKMFEKLYNNAKKFDSDIVMSPIHIFNEETEETSHDLPYFNLECFDESFDNRTFNHSETKNFFFDISVTAWNKIYKKSFIENLDLNFPKLFFEDNPFFYEAYLNANKVSIIRDFLYYYRFKRKGSLTVANDHNFFDIVKIQEISSEIFKKNGFFDSYKMDLFKHSFFDCLGRYKLVSKKFKPDFFNLIKNFIINFGLTSDEINDMKNYNDFKLFQESDSLIEFEIRKEFDSNLKKCQKENNKYINLSKKLNKEIKKQKKDIEYLKTLKGWSIYKIRMLLKWFKNLF